MAEESEWMVDGVALARFHGPVAVGFENVCGTLRYLR